MSGWRSAARSSRRMAALSGPLPGWNAEPGLASPCRSRRPASIDQKSEALLHQRATAVFLVGSRVSPRPIDRARAAGILSTRHTNRRISPMAPLISIVDDDKAVRDALQRMLKSHGFATVVFASAEQFLSRAKSRQAACLILDVRMPGMTGLALHNHLIAAGCRIPTILITACPTSGERQTSHRQRRGRIFGEAAERAGAARRHSSGAGRWWASRQCRWLA